MKRMEFGKPSDKACPVCGVTRGKCIDLTVTATDAPHKPNYRSHPHPARYEDARFSNRSEGDK